ncbi:ASCH domain-containing protein [Paenibacillus sp. YPG26]|uniref:ASCH domain-containing protein n=1 Tax=Paenibacillus sp. YPG26 TaxID=2878915 RepID=UPI002040CE6E|nr:ASCH domain-containing protein [Paenibacillus sp. YPG26]USB33703.1 ASCH domain-containing protein [Paenibacillus sp. YPG26]
MKVLSMIQPWASLFVLGEIKYETRSWRTRYRGPLAIHASLRTDKAACRDEPVFSVLAKHGYTETKLPTGVILATCRLVNCYRVTGNSGDSAVLEEGQEVKGNDYLFGDYRVDHFAWEVEDMTLLPEFIPAKGQLGLWEYPILS